MKYKELMEKAEFLAGKYTEKELLDMTKDLGYTERLKFDCKIRCIREKSTYQDTFATYYHEEEFIKNLVNNEELDYIVKHIGDIIVRAYSLRDVPLAYLKRNQDRISPEDMDRIETCIANATSMYYPNTKEEDMARLKDVLKKAAKEENTNLLDLRKLDHYGCYSKTFQVGSKIIKVGYRRECPNIPENNRILYPYFKGNIGPDYVEINDYVTSMGEVTEEELYEVYKDIREEGLIWIDPGFDNVARVSSDILYKQNQRKKDLTGKGIIENPRHANEIKDILVIDLDHILFENEEDEIERIREKQTELRQCYVEKFEERYNKETSKGIQFKKTRYDYPMYY